jgi:hypothetical protein
MDEIIGIAQKLSSAGLATLLLVIIIGSYKGIWCWGYQLRKAESDGEEWKRMALRAAGLAETSVSIAKRGQ